MKRSNILYLLTGILLGGFLAVTGVAYAAGLTALPSTHRVFIDGEEVEVKGYNIEGNNYYQLRDVGEKVGFNVWWEEDNRTVHVETGTPYTGEAPVQESEEDANTAFCREVLRLVNEARKEAGVQEVVESSVLMKSAQEYAETKPEDHNTQLSYEIRSRNGCKHGVGENLYLTYWNNNTSVEEYAKRAVNGWISSPGHYKTMMNAGSDTAGVGMYVDKETNRTYCVLYIGSCKNAGNHPEWGLGAAHD